MSSLSDIDDRLSELYKKCGQADSAVRGTLYNLKGDMGCGGVQEPEDIAAVREHVEVLRTQIAEWAAVQSEVHSLHRQRAAVVKREVR